MYLYRFNWVFPTRRCHLYVRLHILCYLPTNENRFSHTESADSSMAWWFLYLFFNVFAFLQFVWHICDRAMLCFLQLLRFFLLPFLLILCSNEFWNKSSSNDLHIWISIVIYICGRPFYWRIYLVSLIYVNFLENYSENVFICKMCWKPRIYFYFIRKRN